MHMQENINLDCQHMLLTCANCPLSPYRNIPRVSPQVLTVEGTVMAFMHVHAFMGCSWGVLHQGICKGCKVGVSKAFSDIVMLHYRYALAMA